MKHKLSVTTVALLLALSGAAVAAPAADVALPAPDMSGGMPLMQALAQRKTSREFSPAALEMQVLSDLLWAAFGVNRPTEGKRTAPSARNWQEIDVYVMLEQGLYLYSASDNRLRKKTDTDLRPQAGRQAFVASAPVCLAFVADLERVSTDDENARTFYTAIDAGYISQNVYLYCASHGLNTVAIGSLDKEALAQAMQLRPGQRIIITQPVGYAPGSSKPPATSAAPTRRSGTFRGSATGYDGPIEVEVVVKKGRISAVTVLTHTESAPKDVFTTMPGRVVTAQGAGSVDGVSGATVTSQAFLKAVGQAIAASESGK